MNSDHQSLHVPSIDVFLTYRCSLRCAHCFVGENLNTNRDLDFDLFLQLLEYARGWSTEEFTFLGGEPTLYPQLIEAVTATHREGYRTRIVTNGHTGYSRFLDHLDGPARPFVMFSIDGSGAGVHDRIRGSGSFATLWQNIERSRRLGLRMGGIVTVSRENSHDLCELLQVCDAVGFEYTNIHYVTNRGFASTAMMLSVEEWQATCAAVSELARRLRMRVRIERTFAERVSYPRCCAVREGSNLMFLPDGRVFMCMMFIDVPNAHSFVWTRDGLQPNLSHCSEQARVGTASSRGCAAIEYVNKDVADAAAARGQMVTCIYDKTTL